MANQVGFGITELNLIGPSGTPKIESPNNINLSAVTVAISTHATVGGNLEIDGQTFLGNAASDWIHPAGRISDHLIPVSTGIDLGQSGANSWGNIYSAKTIFANEYSSTGITTSLGGFVSDTGSPVKITVAGSILTFTVGSAKTEFELF